MQAVVDLALLEIVLVLQYSKTVLLRVHHWRHHWDWPVALAKSTALHFMSTLVWILHCTRFIWIFFPSCEWVCSWQWRMCTPMYWPYFGKQLQLLFWVQSGCKWNILFWYVVAVNAAYMLCLVCTCQWLLLWMSMNYLIPQISMSAPPIMEAVHKYASTLWVVTCVLATLAIVLLLITGLAMVSILYMWVSVHLRVLSDTNECLTSNGNCSQICINAMGSYFCSCLSGYNLAADSRTCEGRLLKLFTVIMMT